MCIRLINFIESFYGERKIKTATENASKHDVPAFVSYFMETF